MNQSELAIVADKHGNKVDLAALYEINNGIRDITLPCKCRLKEGQQLIFDGVEEAVNMRKPRWDGKTWIETATPEEIEQKEAELLEMLPQAPTVQASLEDIVLAQYGEIMGLQGQVDALEECILAFYSTMNGGEQ